MNDKSCNNCGYGKMHSGYGNMYECDSCQYKCPARLYSSRDDIATDIEECDPSSTLEVEILQKRIKELGERVFEWEKISFSNVTRGNASKDKALVQDERLFKLEEARKIDRSTRRENYQMAARERVGMYDDIALLKDQLAGKLQRSMNDEYKALKRAEKIEKELVQVKDELKNQQEIMNIPTTTADTLRQAILSSESGEMTKQTAIKELTKMEEAPPHELDNSLAMDIPEEIHAAAKKAGIGLDDLTDLILTVRRENQTAKQWDLEHRDNFSKDLEQVRHTNMKEREVHQLDHMKACNEHTFNVKKLQYDHDKVMMQIRIKDNVNKRDAKVKLAEIKAGVKVKNDHGVSVGADRWKAVESMAWNLGRTVRWTAYAAGGSYIAYAIAQIFVA